MKKQCDVSIKEVLNELKTVFACNATMLDFNYNNVKEGIEMGIVDRLSDLIKANINDMISKAEDPEKMIKQMIFDMEEQLNQAKIEVSKTIAEEKKLKKFCDDEKERVDQWLSKAELAVKNGEDALAIEALERKKKHEVIYNQYKAQFDDQSSLTEEIKYSLGELQLKIDDAKRQKNVLIARAKRAAAKSNIQGAMSQVNNSDAFNTFQRMSEKINEQEFINEANLEVNALSQDNHLERKFDKLSAETEIMNELAKLKEKIL